MSEPLSSILATSSDVQSEYQAARTDAVLFDLSRRGKIQATGRDAATFLHNLTTNDVKALTPGTGCEAFLTTGQAKIIGFVTIERLRDAAGAEFFWMETAPGTIEQVMKHLQHYLVTEDVELADRTSDFAEFHLAGPNAQAVLCRALAGTAPSLSDLQSQIVTMPGVGVVRIRRHDILAMPGYDMLTPSSQAEDTWKALNSSGARSASAPVLDVLRVEAGTPVYGIDIDETNLPQEVGRTERAVSFTKGCYIGQETIARIRTYGHVNRLLVGLTLAGKEPAAHRTKLFRDGQEIGYVTSSVYSPRLSRAITLGYVRRGSETPDTIVHLQAPEGPAAEVVMLPFAADAAAPGARAPG